MTIAGEAGRCPTTGKVQWVNEERAKNAAFLYNIKNREWAGDVGMTAYRCNACGGWHIGHEKP